MDARLVFAVPCDDDSIDEALDDPRTTIMLIADGLGNGLTSFHASSLWRSFTKAIYVFIAVMKQCYQPHLWINTISASGNILTKFIAISLNQEFTKVDFIPSANSHVPVLPRNVEAGRA